MKTQLRESLLFYGFAKISGQTNSTEFFEFEDLTEEEKVTHGQFRELNRQTLETIGSKEWDGTTYRCNEDIFGEWTVDEWKTILALPAKLQVKEPK